MKTIEFFYESESDSSDEYIYNDFARQKVAEIRQFNNKLTDSIENLEFRIAFKKLGIEKNLDNCTIDELRLASEWMKKNEAYLSQRVEGWGLQSDFDKKYKKTFNKDTWTTTYEFMEERFTIVLTTEKVSEVKIYDAPGVWGGLSKTKYKGYIHFQDDNAQIFEFLGENTHEEPLSYYLISQNISYEQKPVEELNSMRSSEGCKYTYEKDGEKRYAYEVLVNPNGDDPFFVSLIYSKYSPDLQTVISKFNENSQG